MLSHYGIIPEGVVQVTSVTARRGKRFENSLGCFSYQHVPSDYYALGIEYVKASERVGFMVASREKALCDWLALMPYVRVYSAKGLRVLLVEAMRMGEAILAELDGKKVLEFAEAGFRTERLMWLGRFLSEGV